ncbi:hypothetical protein ACOSP7_019239 [Xanthoceras sorbifolium]
MKCCSLRRKDLNHYYKKMSGRYYMVNSLNDESLRQVYINSLPEELQIERSVKSLISRLSANLTNVLLKQRRRSISCPKKEEKITYSNILKINKEEDTANPTCVTSATKKGILQNNVPTKPSNL